MKHGTRALIAVIFAVLGAALPGHALTYRTYENPKIGIALSVPEEWEMRQERDGTVTINGSTGVLVVSARPRGTCTPESLRQHASLYVLNENPRLQNSGRKTVNGYSGWLFQYVTRNADDPLRGDTLCLLHDDSLLIVAFVTREWLYKATRPVFEECIRSIRLTTPPGKRALAPGYRRYEDRERAFRLQVPEEWTQGGDARMPIFSGEHGTLQIFTDSSARYLPGDGEILARAYVDKASYKMKSLARGKLDGHPAHFAFCTLPDRPDWVGCFIVLIRDQKLYVLKMAHHAEHRKALLEDVVRSFQFASDGAPPAPQVSQVEPTAAASTP
jgi:hypothetical protein